MLARICVLLLCVMIQMQAAQPKKAAFQGIFSIRSVENGITLAINRSSQDRIVQNWRLKEIVLDANLQKHDRLRNLLPVGTVQFVDPKHQDRCLAINQNGLFVGRSCTEDVIQGKLETVFSIMPTNTTAVQIRSLVLGANECVATFENAHLPVHERFGILPCVLDIKQIPKNLLFIFTPPLMEATPL